MILITIIAIVMYVYKSFNYLGSIELAPHVSLQDIDTYLLASFGIGQGAYLAKRQGQIWGMAEQACVEILREFLCGSPPG
jgi:hypothetical protein